MRLPHHVMAFIAAALIPASAASAGSRQTECFSGFHQCMRENKGQMKMCMERRDACMKGEKPSGEAGKPKKVPSPFLNIECSKKYSKCMGQRKANKKLCDDAHSRCRRGEEEEAPSAAKGRDGKTDTPAAKKNPKKSVETRPADKPRGVRIGGTSTKGIDGPCWTMNVSKKTCAEWKSEKCKTMGNAFRTNDDCAACLNDYRLPMGKVAQPVFQYVQMMKLCKEERRDLDKLEECIKTIKDADERAASRKYLEAQRAIDGIVADAKARGIHGCGNFSRVR